MRILALDIGSTSVKAGLWTGRTFSARARVPFPTRFEGHAAEIDAATLLHAMFHAVDRVLRGKRSVEAVAFCTFSSGVILTDDHSKPLTPIITHADRRSAATAISLVKRRPKSWWLTRTGNLPYPGGIGSSTLAWLRQNRPALFRRPYRAGQVSSFVGSFLTGGSWLTDPSQAVFLGLWDIRRDRWEPDVCRVVGVSPEALPECRWADEVAGGLSAAVARRWGLTPGLPVLGGFVDTSAAVIQTPMGCGQLAHNAGSTDVLALCVDQPHPAEGILSRPVGVSERWSGGNRKSVWLAVRTVASAGSALAWVRNVFYPHISDDSWRSLLDQTSRTSHPDDPDRVQCIPTFAGERAMLHQPPGAALSNLRLSTGPREILESMIRALAKESALNYGILARVCPPEKMVYAMGGASALANAIHARWPGKHVFRRLAGDGLKGLVLLAQRALG